MTHTELLEIARHRFGEDNLTISLSHLTIIYKMGRFTERFVPIEDSGQGRAQAADLVIHYHVSIRYDELADKWLWLNVSVPRWETNCTSWQLAVCAGALAAVRKRK